MPQPAERDSNRETKRALIQNGDFSALAAFPTDVNLDVVGQWRLLGNKAP